MPASIETQVDASGTGAAKALTLTLTGNMSEAPSSAVVMTVELSWPDSTRRPALPMPASVLSRK